MKPPPFDVDIAQRWFAIELNNTAWDLVEMADRTVEQTSMMLSAAHGARYHWYQVGTNLNKLRADTLLATAYLSAGYHELAHRYALDCSDLSLQLGEEQTSFDKACVQGVLAGALARLGRRDEAHDHYAQATAIAERFDDPAERPVFERLYPPV